MHASHEHEPHPCPRTGKCCGRCKLAIPGNAANADHALIASIQSDVHEALRKGELAAAVPQPTLAACT